MYKHLAPRPVLGLHFVMSQWNCYLSSLPPDPGGREAGNTVPKPLYVCTLLQTHTDNLYPRKLLSFPGGSAFYKSKVEASVVI
jgi:hypothetical protein